MHANNSLDSTFNAMVYYSIAYDFPIFYTQRKYSITLSKFTVHLCKITVNEVLDSVPFSQTLWCAAQINSDFSTVVQGGKNSGHSWSKHERKKWDTLVHLVHCALNIMYVINGY